MRYLPIFLDVKAHRALIVGGGGAAVPKIRLLCRAGAAVTVVAPVVDSEIALAAQAGELEWWARPFATTDVEGCAVVYAATGRGDIDARVAGAARTKGVLANVVDRPDLSSFVMPAIVDRDPVIVGISTGGAAPVLARRLRARIEGLLPDRLGRLARFAEAFRTEARARVPAAARRRFWERFFDGPIAAQVLAGDEADASVAMAASMRANIAAPTGGVAIVGAGPGSPDLLTWRAARLLQDADVVVHDRLVGSEIIELARRDAPRIDVGKAPGQHSHSQNEINALLHHHASQGRRVVRLKGGDPFIFGRGGEELEYLAARDVAVEVVPGITAAVGCAAAAGIPLTHRDAAQAVTFVTGHGAAGEPELDWAGLATARRTLVIYMGIANAASISTRLMALGCSAGRPVAVIENGSLPGERTVTGTLGGLSDLIRVHGITAPALIIIGDVVHARQTLGADSLAAQSHTATAPMTLADAV